MGQGNKEKYYGIITLNTKKESEDLTIPGICWDPEHIYNVLQYLESGTSGQWLYDFK